ncbi:arylsulfatase [Microlunatus sp. Y2014]|uniref:arylsulfatase n=1 Tax=Microlunatus sp. Y2014 TaxID=3418488 RepID=UPI003DA79B14
MAANIVIIHVDNLGMGELGCYGGGIVRGAPTPRIDALAREGHQLWHYIAEPQCSPSRSALLTGRHAIRSGTYAIPEAGGTGGLIGWERTLGDQLHDAGYATTCLGKWHLGAEHGRWPTDHGFETFYGPARTYTECLWPEDPWYRPGRDPESFMVEGTIADGVRELTDERLTLERRRDVDADYLDRATAFMADSVREEQPFFLYFNHSMLHMPTIPRPEFAGSTGQGDWADCLAELDADVGVLLDTIDDLGIGDDTIVIFAGDNGAEDNQPWRGSSGVFDGSYFSSSEGGLRTPCLVRWPGVVAAGQVSNQLVHQVDLFTTLLGWAGVPVPEDREIDGLDQRDFLSGTTRESAREGCIVWVRDQVHAVKWHDFKVVYRRQQHFRDAPETLGYPDVVNLTIDPKERERYTAGLLHTWVPFHARRLLDDFSASCVREPVVPAGAPVDHR